MKHASLFSGIGGFDLAAEWVGWENEFHCEWNAFGKRVLNYYWPKAKSYDDITKTDFTEWRGKIDVLTGGFPCQPYSVAGKRLGKEDERHLWPHMLRAIQEIQPRYVVGENVRGIISWNGGLVFDEVQADLETEGYTVIPCVLPACGVNAPHRRERVWFIAYRNSIGLQVERTEQQAAGITRSSEGGITSDTESLENIGRGQGRFQSEPARLNAEGITSNTDSSTTGTPRESGSFKSSWCENNDVKSERGMQTELNNRPFEFLQSSPNTDNARNATPRSGIVGDWTEDIIERQLSQSEFSGHGFTTDTNNQRSSAGPGIVSETNGEIPKWYENAEPGNASSRDASYSHNQRCEEQHVSRQPVESIELNRRFDADRTDWQNFPAQPPICGGDDGLSRELDGITFPKWLSESIKAYGNAIVPVVAYEIFKVIDKLDRELLRYL